MRGLILEKAGGKQPITIATSPAFNSQPGERGSEFVLKSWLAVYWERQVSGKRFSKTKNNWILRLRELHCENSHGCERKLRGKDHCFSELMIAISTGSVYQTCISSRLA